jgi:hypothetical protein
LSLKSSSLTTISVPVESTTIEERPTTPPAKAVRLTRRQLAKQEEELRESQRIQSPPPHSEPEPTPVTEEVAPLPVKSMQEEPTTIDIPEDTATGAEEESVAETITELENAAPVEDTTQEPELEQLHDVMEASEALEDVTEEAEETENIKIQEAVAPELEEVHQEEWTEKEPAILETLDNTETQPEFIAPSVEVTSEPEPKTLAAERPCDVSRTPSMNRTSSRRASRSPSKSPMRIEESIEALDALEEALENVGKAVSHYDQSTDEKSPRKKAVPRGAATPSAQAKTPRKTPLALRVSRTPSAAPKSIKPTNNSLARAASLRVAPVKEIRKPSDTTDYLASKRRPVSVSFPTPPPPPKGRAPTKPTFQLSSDAVAAKLKVQKEDRQKREAEREAGGAPLKQRPISMPPVAKSTKAPTKATFVLPGEAIAAKLRAQKEERLKREVESTSTEQPKARPVSISMAPGTVKSTKPVTKASFQLPGEAVAAKLRAQREERQKREEEAEAAKKAAAAPRARPLSMRKPVTLPTRSQPGLSIPPPPPPRSDSLQPPETLRSSSLSSNKRNSIQLTRSTSVSTTTSNRSSLVVKAIVTPVDAVQQKLKGSEVFNRDRNEKDAKDRERKDKEEAAKQARAQAAERGRIASREWAERQRRKMMDAVKAKAEAA